MDNRYTVILPGGIFVYVLADEHQMISTNNGVVHSFSRHGDEVACFNADLVAGVITRAAMDNYFKL